MADIRNGVASQNQYGFSADDSLAATLSSDKGNSGTGSGITLAGTSTIDCFTTFGFYPRQVYITGAGNFSFKTLDGNSHVLSVAAQSWISAIFISEIYQASHATLATTATGVHVF